MQNSEKFLHAAFLSLGQHYNSAVVQEKMTRVHSIITLSLNRFLLK